MVRLPLYHDFSLRLTSSLHQIIDQGSTFLHIIKGHKSLCAYRTVATALLGRS